MRLCLDQPSVWNWETSSSPCCVWVYRISMSCWTLPLRVCGYVCPTAIRWHLSCFHVCFCVLRVHSSCFVEVTVMIASSFLGALLVRPFISAYLRSSRSCLLHRIASSLSSCCAFWSVHAQPSVAALLSPCVESMGSPKRLLFSTAMLYVGGQWALPPIYLSLIYCCDVFDRVNHVHSLFTLESLHTLHLSF